MLRTNRARRRTRLALAAAATAVATFLPVAAATAAPAGAPVAAPAARAELPASERPALYARDQSGVLWQYEGTGYSARPFKTPVEVGPGWAYRQVTSLAGTTADGKGDLAAVDRDGTLYFYQGTGNPSFPFARRIKVGGGWDRYVSIAGATDANNDGKNDLVARDREGVLWFYAGTGVPSAPFAPPVRVGGGWNAYDIVTTYSEGVLARDHDGVLWAYKTTGSSRPDEPFYRRVQVGSGWGRYTDVVGVRDIDGDKLADVVARDADGKLWLHYGVRSQGIVFPMDGALPIGGGWNAYTMLF